MTNVVANGSSTSAVSITLRDASSNPVAGIVPTFAATDTGGTNSYGICSATNAAGIASCTLASTNAEAKTLSLVTPVAKAGGSVTFINGPAAKLAFTAQPAGGVAEGVALPTQPALTLFDAFDNPVVSGADASANVTLSLSAGTGSLSGTLTRAASGGVVAFTGLSVSTQGAGKVITATKADTSGSGGSPAVAQASDPFTIHPPAPGAFAVSAAAPSASGAITLTWAAAANAASYKVSYGTSAGVFGTVASSAATSPYTVSGLSDGVTYYFRVEAVNVTGTTAGSPDRSAVADATPPSAPGTPAWANAYGAFTTATPQLSWAAATSSGSAVARYEVALGTSAGASNVVGWVTAGSNSIHTFSGLSLTNGGSYYASVRAVDGIGLTGPVASSGAMVVDSSAPATPTAVIDGSVVSTPTVAPTISWTASTSSGAGSFAGYELALGTSAGATDILGWTTLGNVTSYTPSSGFTLVDGTLYFASVRAVKTTGLRSGVASGDGFTLNTSVPSFTCDFLASLSTDCLAAPLASTYRPLIRFSRAEGANASPGTYVDTAGLVRTAPKNLLLQSQDADLSPWFTQALTVTANAGTAPDGTNTARFMQEDSTASQHMLAQFPTLAINVPYVLSVYAKGGPRFLTLNVSNGVDGNMSLTTFDLGSGTVAAGPGTITPAGSGWYRLAITFTPHDATNGVNLKLYDGVNGWSYTGDGTQGIYIWGAQLEQGTVPTNYIYTQGAPAFGARIDHDPGTCPAGVCARKGLLIEGPRTNLLPNSAALFPTFTVAGVTTANDVAIAPDGTSTADVFMENAATASPHYVSAVLPVAANQNLAFSVFVKPIGRTDLLLRISEHPTTTNNVTTQFRLASKTTGVSQSGLGLLTPGSSTIQAYPNGWFRISIAGTPTTAATANIRLYIQGYTGGTTYDGDVTKGFYVWGAQLEAGEFSSSYIPTAGTSLTRYGDSAVVRNLASDWFDAAAGTLTATASLRGGGNATSLQRVAWFNDGTSNNRVGFSYAYSGTSGYLVPGFNVGGVNPWPGISSGSFALDAPTCSAIAFAPNDVAASVAGTNVVATSSATLPAVDRLDLGGLQGSNGLFGWLQIVRHYKTRLNDTKLKQITR